MAVMLICTMAINCLLQVFLESSSHLQGLLYEPVELLLPFVPVVEVDLLSYKYSACFLFGKFSPVKFESQICFDLTFIY